MVFINIIIAIIICISAIINFIIIIIIAVVIIAAFVVYMIIISDVDCLYYYCKHRLYLFPSRSFAKNPFAA